MSDQWTERLSDYFDEGLSPDERVLLEAHLATCGECRTTLDELGAVVTRARSLTDHAPGEDLWPGIAARVAVLAQESAVPVRVAGESARGAAGSAPRGTRRTEGAGGTGSAGSAGRAGGGWFARGLTLSWPQLAAAGIALMILSGAVAWFAGSRAGGKDSRIAERPAMPAESSQVAGLVSREAVDPAYAAEVAKLERVLTEKRNELDPETVRTIEANLRIIDLASAQAKRALDADPANPYLQEHLSKTMQRKIEVLKQATVFASAQ